MPKKPDWLICKDEIIAGASWRVFITILIENKLRIHPKYWLRFLYALFLVTISTPLRFIQWVRFNGKIKRTELIEDPIFIIGNYRTGSTYLMTLMTFDKRMGYVSNVETYAPHMFLGFPRFTRWLIDSSLPDTRPMDNVKMYPELPTEEEYAVGAMSKYGYYNAFVFPRNFDKYSSYLTFEGKPKDLEKWKKVYHYFVQMMTLKYKGKQLFFKNPSNCYKLPHVLEMYPNAKFIHIYRNPYNLYASIYKFFDTTIALFALQTWDKDEIKKTILQNFKLMYEYLERDMPLIKEENITHVKYEDFIQEPLETIDRIYEELSLELDDEYRNNIKDYSEAQKRDYKTNVHNISPEVIELVNQYMEDYREKFGYEKL